MKNLDRSWKILNIRVLQLDKIMFRMLVMFKGKRRACLLEKNSKGKHARTVPKMSQKFHHRKD